MEFHCVNFIYGWRWFPFPNSLQNDAKNFANYGFQELAYCLEFYFEIYICNSILRSLVQADANPLLSSSTGHCRNPQTEALLQLLELEYLLDNKSESSEFSGSPASFISSNTLLWLIPNTSKFHLFHCCCSTQCIWTSMPTKFVLPIFVSILILVKAMAI